MTTLGIIGLVFAGTFIIAILCFIAYCAGQLSILKENIRESQARVSWASINIAQSQFNIDFFDALYAEKSPRLSCFES